MFRTSKAAIHVFVLALLSVAASEPQLRGSTSFGAQDAVDTGIHMVEPVEGSTKLTVNRRGLDVLRSIKGPVAPIVVIGPYRSGKSFFINQMLERRCDDGMVVGHSRSTQTKGVWMWRRPVEVPGPDGGPPLSLLFFDTEGFESTGKSDAYDDRIFALAAIISSTLVYNLAEAVRESDIEKLSFAVELAQAFYDGGGRADAAQIEPSHMLWLIQRDFLQGKSTQSMLDEALAPVANPHNAADIAGVNRIRASLAMLARNSTAVGLPQPHIDRTRLCEMTDSDFAPEYVRKRDEVKTYLKATARPKVLRQQVLDGAGLAQLLEKMVDALNARDIPSSASILDTFNQQLLHECIDAHAASLEAVALPATLEWLQAAHDRATERALARLKREAFGRVDAALEERLTKALHKSWAEAQRSNEVSSNRVCERLEMECEDGLERLSKMALPSLGKFDTRSAQCAARFAASCVGPALKNQRTRLEHAHTRERGRFQKEYNDRLLSGLVALSLVTIVVSRFVLKWMLPEVLGWIIFVFLEVYPRISMRVSNMYESGWWRRLVSCWELIVFNPFLDLEAWWFPLLVAGVALSSAWRFYRRKHRQPGKKVKDSMGASRDLDV